MRRKSESTHLQPYWCWRLGGPGPRACVFMYTSSYAFGFHNSTIQQRACWGMGCWNVDQCREILSIEFGEPYSLRINSVETGHITVRAHPYHTFCPLSRKTWLLLESCSSPAEAVQLQTPLIQACLVRRGLEPRSTSMVSSRSTTTHANWVLICEPGSFPASLCVYHLAKILCPTACSKPFKCVS